MLIPTYSVPPQKQSTFLQKVTQYQARDVPPQTAAPILKLSQGPGVWARKGLGSPVASGKRNLSGALRSLQWRTLKAARELEILSPPSFLVGNALEVS